MKHRSVHLHNLTLYTHTGLMYFYSSLQVGDDCFGSTYDSTYDRTTFVAAGLESVKHMNNC